MQAITDDERRQKRYEARKLQMRIYYQVWKQNNLDKRREMDELYRGKPDRKARELERLNKRYSSVKEFNRLKHLGDFYLWV